MTPSLVNTLSAVALVAGGAWVWARCRTPGHPTRVAPPARTRRRTAAHAGDSYVGPPRRLAEFAALLPPRDLDDLHRYARARGMILTDDTPSEDVERIYQMWRFRL